MADHAQTELDDAGDWAVISKALSQLEQAWQAGADPDLSAFLPPPDNRLHQRVLVDLIKIDQECHWRRGDRQKLEAYLARWPELEKDLAVLADLVEAECLTRALWDTMPSKEEIRSRFPAVLPRIDFARIQAEVDTERQRLPAGTSGDAFHSGPSKRNARQPLTAGQAFGRLQVRSLIGEGAMGWVYRAYHPDLDRDVALKIPRFDVAADAAMRGRFQREGKALAKIRHANICPVYDAGEIDGIYYIAMALIEGRSLADCVRTRPIGPREAAELLRKLALGLAAAHAGQIVHRDIKPSNIMIECGIRPEQGEGKGDSPIFVDHEYMVPAKTGTAPDGQCASCPTKAGTDPEPLLMDFGLARPIEDDAQSSGNALLGTLPYMSPEQLDGQPAGVQSDIYALGTVFYEALTGRLPFPPDGSAARMLRNILDATPPRPRDLRPEIDPALEEICLRAIAKDPADRYQSAKEMADALERWSSGFSRQSTDLPPKGGTPARSRWKRLAWLAGAAAAVLLGIVVYVKIDKWSAKLEVKREQAQSGPSFPSIARWIPVEPPGVGVSGVRVSRDGGTLFLSCDLQPQPLPVLTMDAATGKVLHRVAFKDASYEHKGIAASLDDRFLYVTNYDYNRDDISRIDLKDNYRQTDLLIGGISHKVWAGWQIETTPDGRKLLVGLGQDCRSVDMDNDFLSIVDISEGKFVLIGQVKLDDEPDGWQMAISGDSRFAYLVTRPRKSPAATLYEVSLTAPFKVARRLAFPNGKLQGIALSNRLKRIFIADTGNRKVQVVGTTTFKPVSSIELDACAPATLALNARETLLVVAAPDNKRLFFIDPASGKVRGQLGDFRQAPFTPRFSPDDRWLYVPHNAENGAIAVVDLGNLALRYSIVFASDRGGEGQQLYAMDGDGRNVRRLTNNRASDRCPRWSPDGKRIAFISDREGPRRICLMDREGKNATVLKDTDPAPADSCHAPLDWSPDGTQIAFVGNDHKAIRAVNVNTGEIRTLVEGEANAALRGTVPFSRPRSAQSSDAAEPRKSGQSPGYAHHLGVCWNKSNGKVLFESQNPASGYEHAVFEVDPKTRKITLLVDEGGRPEYCVSQASSPDGKQLAAVRVASRAANAVVPICLADADGRNPQPLPATASSFNAAPRWSPDGQSLVYQAKRGDRWHIFLLGLAGGKPNQLTAGECDDIEADVSWSTADN